MTVRQKLALPGIAAAGVLVVGLGVVLFREGGRYGERFDPRERFIQRTYDRDSGQLIVFAYDRNRDGKKDAWTYLEHERMLRTEVDENQDGIVDRWYYYGGDQQLLKVGSSRLGDGVVDEWRYLGPQDTTRMIEYSERRDGVVTRREHFSGGVVTSVESVPARSREEHQ